MKTELKGKVYEAVYLTDEEKVVIDAMRAGAKVRVGFFDLTYEEIVEFTDELPKSVLPIRETRDFHEANLPFIVVEARSENVELNLFVKMSAKKPPVRASGIHNISTRRIIANENKKR